MNVIGRIVICAVCILNQNYASNRNEAIFNQKVENRDEQSLSMAEKYDRLKTSIGKFGKAVVRNIDIKFKVDDFIYVLEINESKQTVKVQSILGKWIMNGKEISIDKIELVDQCFENKVIFIINSYESLVAKDKVDEFDYKEIGSTFLGESISTYDKLVSVFGAPDKAIGNEYFYDINILLPVIIRMKVEIKETVGFYIMTFYLPI